MLLNQVDPLSPGDCDRGKLWEWTEPRSASMMYSSPRRRCHSLISDRPPAVGPRMPLTTRGRWVAFVWRQFIYDWRLLKLSATVLDDWSCLMQPRRVVHTHTHHGGIKQLQLFERRQEWRDVTRDKLTVGIEFHTAHCRLSDRRGWPDGTAPQTVVCPVLARLLRKVLGGYQYHPILASIGQYPIPQYRYRSNPNAGASFPSLAIDMVKWHYSK